MDTKGRLRLGIVLNFRKGWMGGILYIVNLVNALNYLDEDEKPEIIVFYHRDLTPFLKDFRYPFLQTIEWKFHGLVKGYIQSWIKGQNVFVEEMLAKYQLDGIYPLNDSPVSGMKALQRGTRIVGWIPDLQHKFFPQYFKRSRLILRDIRFKMLLRNTTDLVVSSRDVETHFHRFYSIPETLRLHVLRFPSLIDFSSIPDFRSVQIKYKLPEDYFIVSNQFTNHKNHPVVLRAIDLLKDRTPSIHVVFTGKMDFKGNEEYIAGFRRLISEKGLEKFVSLLDVIPRQEQLALMRHAKAIIQPSLFEGWSTVIEDGKSLGVPVIAADLPVNLEQLGSDGYFFAPHDAAALAGITAGFDARRLPGYDEYCNRVKSFAEKFIRIFK